MPSKTQSILLSGGIIGVALAIVQFIPVVGACLCVLAVIGAGVLAVWHYTNTYALTISGGAGAGMGALAAVVAAVVDGIIGFVMATFGLTLGPREVVRRALESMEESGLSPEQLEQARQVLESPFLLPGVFICTIVLYAAFGAIGGAIGAAVFKKGGEEPAPPTRSSQEPPSDPSRGGETNWRTE